MSGLLALLDDVAAIAKLAASQLDDIAVKAGKASAKAAGIVIDDSAVTPKYVHGLPAARELPIVWQIAKGSLFNKLVILLPACLLLNAFAPWLLTPLLMIGGAYLCFEGAEKVWHWLYPHSDEHHQPETLDAAHLEKERVAGAIKTDFILSAEIMVIALSTVSGSTIWTTAAVLAFVGVAITAVVYGAVALLVKADDLGLRLSQTGSTAGMRGLGRGIVAAMPSVMNWISAIGTAAMLWVGGSIIIHGLKELGWPWLEKSIVAIAAVVGSAVPVIGSFVDWLVKAGIDGALGLLLGLALIPVTNQILVPLASRLKAARAS